MGAGACFKQNSLFAFIVSSAVLVLPTSWRWLSTSSSMEAPALLYSTNVVLTAGPYKGSTVTITWRDHMMEPLRELSVVGGTGRFRMATGYVLWRTASWQFLENAILELDVYVHMSAVAYA